MRNETIYYSLLLIIIAGLTLFRFLDSGDPDKNDNKIIVFESFQKLRIDLNCNVYVSIGDEQKVVCEGPHNLLNDIETRLENDILLIQKKNDGFFKKWFTFKKSDMSKINLYVKLKDTKHLITPVKGNIISQESFYPEAFEEKEPEINLSEFIRIISRNLSSILFR